MELDLGTIIALLTLLFGGGGLIKTINKYKVVFSARTIKHNDGHFSITIQYDNDIVVNKIVLHEDFIQGLKEILSLSQGCKNYIDDIYLCISSFRNIDEHTSREIDLNITPPSDAYTYRGLAGSDSYYQFCELEKALCEYITTKNIGLTIKFKRWHLRKQRIFSKYNNINATR